MTVAEALGIKLTERAISELEKFGVRVGAIVVNYVIDEASCNCPFHRERATTQRAYIDEPKRIYGQKKHSSAPSVKLRVWRPSQGSKSFCLAAKQVF